MLRQANRQGQVNVAVVLGANPRPDGSPSPAMERRVSEALACLNDGRADLLILSGGPVTYVRSEAEIMADLARARGAPEAALLLEDKANNTFENVLFSLRLLEKRKIEPAVLGVVTEPYHMPRARLIFERFGLSAVAWPCRSGRFGGRRLMALGREAGALAYYGLTLRQRVKKLDNPPSF